MDSFAKVLTKFKQETGTQVMDGSILKVVDFDLGEFKQKFQEMCKPFIVILDKFHWFIVWFFIFNLFTVLCLLWSFVLNYEDKRCKLSVFYYIHYLTEIAYFLGLWLALARKLNRNYQLIIQYKDELMDSAIIDSDLFDYLDSVIERKSPFAIFGVINPSNQTFGLLVTSVVVPLVVQIYQSADSYTVQI